jgi:hypothetical protein
VHWDGVGLAPSRRRAPFVDPVWVFLERARFAAKTLGFGGWKSLDFLGFSRPNRDLSMGYTGFPRKFFPRAFCPMGRCAGRGADARGHAETQDCLWGKLSLVSDFLQELSHAHFSSAAACIQPIGRSPGKLNYRVESVPFAQIADIPRQRRARGQVAPKPALKIRLINEREGREQSLEAAADFGPPRGGTHRLSSLAGTIQEGYRSKHVGGRQAERCRSGVARLRS